MRKFLVVLGGFVTLLFIVFVGLVAYVLTFDPNENKDWIAGNFRDSTGRELVLGGDVSLTIYPWAGITVDDVSISNAPGFSATPLLQAEHIAVRVKLMSLLNGSYEIDKVRLDGVRLNLEVLGNGESNWSSSIGAEEDGLRAASARNADAGVPSIIIGGVDIQNAELVYDDQFANTHYEISNFDLSISELVYGAPLDVRMNFDATSRAPQLAVSANIAGTVLYDIDAGHYDLDPLQLEATLRGPNVPTGSADIVLSTALSANPREDTLTLRNLEFDALGTHLNASIDIARSSTPTPAVNANLTLAGSDLAVLFRIMEQEELAQRIGSLNSAFKITASADADMATAAVSVPTLQAEMLGANIDGTLSARRINTQTPAFSGNLTAAGPDLPTLIEVLGMLQGGSDSALSRIGRQLREGVRNRAFTLYTEFDADLESGNVQLPALTAALLGFRLNGNLDARNMNNGGTIDGALALEGDNLREVLAALGQEGLAEVAQSLSLDVAVSGSSDNLRISPLDLDLVLYGARIPNSPQTLALNADTVLNLDDDSLCVDAFTLAGLGLNVSGNVAVSNLAENPSYEGHIEGPAFNARRLLQQLNLDAPQTADANSLTSVAYARHSAAATTA